jgi:hypothetical protein
MSLNISMKHFIEYNSKVKHFYDSDIYSSYLISIDSLFS